MRERKEGIGGNVSLRWQHVLLQAMLRRSFQKRTSEEEAEYMRILLIMFMENFFVFDDSILVAYAGFVIIFFTVVLLFKRPESETAKHFFFWTIAILALAVTAYISAHTVYKNAVLSPTGGPVHWHADFRIFQCGEELGIINPAGLSNRVGTPLVHEHGDNRIHIEGIILSQKDYTLGRFFEEIGGALGENSLAFEAENGFVVLKNGDPCPNGKLGILNVFLWSAENGVAHQSKIFDFVNYGISPHSLVPPGDCVIFEFSSEEKPFTDHICEQYSMAESLGDIQIIPYQ